MKWKYKRIGKIRIKRNLGYPQLAKEMGTSLTCIYNIVQGITTTPWETTEYKIDQWLARPENQNI